MSNPPTDLPAQPKIPSLALQQASDPPSLQPSITGAVPDRLLPSEYQQQPSSSYIRTHRSKVSLITDDQFLNHILPTPEETQCVLHINFDKSVTIPNLQLTSPEPLRFQAWTWDDRAAYEELTAEITRHFNTYQKEIRKDPQNVGIKVYRSYGSCRVVGERNEGPHSILEDYEAETLESKAIQNICGFIYKYPLERFQLEFRLDFSMIRKEPETYGSRYDRMVSAEIKSKFKKHHLLAQDFLPRVHRDQLTTQLIMSNIFKQEGRYTDDQITKHCRDIVNQGASILFIACISNSIEIEIILHWIMIHRFNDINLPRETQTELKCPNSCNQSIRCLRNLNAFFARTIRRDGKRHVLDDDEVMPILNIPETTTSHGNIRKLETILGSGSFGTVTAVEIDPSHHELTGDPDRKFALKTFNDHGDPGDVFKREFSMLEILFHKKHPHLVTHITSWTQRSKHYILYPKARRNLRLHMKEYGPPGRSGVAVTWLLRQLNGLASALRCMHKMTEVAANFPDQVDMVQTNEEGNQQGNQLEWSYHHDIKPENILVFEHNEDQNPIFKLSDFGAGRFHRMPKNHYGKPSQTGSDLHGTSSYYAPEYSERKSRPLDIWAMACVYFEVMIWYCLPQYHLDAFHRARAISSRRTPGWVNDLYWRFAPGTEKAELSPAVENYFRFLKEEIEKDEEDVQSLLSELLALIRDCFQIDYEKRPKVENLCDKLHELEGKADARLTKDEHEPITQAVSGISGINEGLDAEEPRPRSPNRRISSTFPVDRSSFPNLR